MNPIQSQTSVPREACGAIDAYDAYSNQHPQWVRAANIIRFRRGGFQETSFGSRFIEGINSRGSDSSHEKLSGKRLLSVLDDMSKNVEKNQAQHIEPFLSSLEDLCKEKTSSFYRSVMGKVDAIRLKLDPAQVELQNNRECASIQSDSDTSDRTTNESSSALSSQRSSKDIEAAHVEKKEPSLDVKTALDGLSQENLKQVVGYFHQLQVRKPEILSLLEKP